jgi:hypothetical protein
MTLEQAETIVGLVCDYDGEGTATVHRNYVGRGMYGSEGVPAISVEDSIEAMELGWYARAADIAIEDLPSRSDQLGTGMIYY